MLIFKSIKNFVVYILFFYIVMGAVFSSGKIAVLNIYARELEGTNYKLKDVEINTTNKDSSSGNYNLLQEAGSKVDLNTAESSNYKLGSGHANTLRANTPKVSCFETNTNGSTDCTSLSTGTVEFCGESGCYNKARFEIDPQGNPDDTKYEILITDDDWNTTWYVDGATHTIEDETSHDLNDFKTLEEWQVVDGAIDWSKANLLGLKPQTTYKIKIVAYRGKYTESFVSPEKEATTVLPIISMDIDVGTNSTVETDPPYVISFGNIVAGIVKELESKVYLDVSTNLENGINVFIKDVNAGMHSAEASYTISSINGDLDSVNIGFGIKVLSLNQAGGPGFIRPVSKYYSSSPNYVGDVNTTEQLFLCSLESSTEFCDGATVHSPVLDARVEVTAKIKVDASVPPGNYTDTISFYGVANW